MAPFVCCTTPHLSLEVVSGSWTVEKNPQRDAFSATWHLDWWAKVVISVILASKSQYLGFFIISIPKVLFF
jgi:hypothetical protein